MTTRPRRSFRQPGKILPLRPPPRRRRFGSVRRLPWAILATPLLGLAALLAAAWQGAVPAATRVSGRTSEVRVIDGDTLALRGVRIRIATLDCAERGAPAGEAATRAARGLLRSGERIECGYNGTRSYGREVGSCAIDGVDFGRTMIRDGHCSAWTFRAFADAWLE